ncbi:hypothetical protein LTR66_015034, partial [Elasticomyces elasticus]
MYIHVGSIDVTRKRNGLMHGRTSPISIKLKMMHKRQDEKMTNGKQSHRNLLQTGLEWLIWLAAHRTTRSNSTTRVAKHTSTKSATRAQYFMDASHVRPGPVSMEPVPSDQSTAYASPAFVEQWWSSPNPSGAQEAR